MPNRHTFLLLALLLAALLLPARPPARAETALVPLGPAQSAPRAAYRALFEHLGAGGRALWAQRVFEAGGASHPPGTVVVPGGLAGAGFDNQVLSGTLAITPVLALDGAGARVALLRSTVSDPTYGSAAWELADLRETLDTYLLGAVAYDVLDEQALAQADLSRYALVVAPAVRRGNERQMLDALGPQALAKLGAFVRAGGFLYAQGNGAAVAEGAGLVAPGTVDISASVALAAHQPANTGLLSVTQPASPLAFSWITQTLYLLSDPPYTQTAGLETVAEFANLDGPARPALLTGQVGLGRVILVDGHPTAASRRAQVPLFIDALLWASGHPAELAGDAVQTYNPALDPHLLPAYEAGVPVSATLTFSNVWDLPLEGATITETVAAGFAVDPASLTPPGGALTALPDGRSQIVWGLGSVPSGALRLGFAARTAAPGLQKQQITFAEGQASFTLEGRPHRIAHRPFTLASRMAARLQADRDLEPDRQYSIPPEGVYEDITLPIENKEDTLAAQVVVTDVVPLIVPLVDLDDQTTILAQNNGETVWMRNEVLFYNERTGRPYLPASGASVSQTLGLADWDGQTRAVFDVPYGTHGTVAPGFARPQGLGNFVTIPPGYTDAITLTADHRLLLPAKVLTWTLDLWPGYHYEAPALRYAVRSRELLGRAVTFAGDPGIAPQQVVVRGTGGSVYTHLGASPTFDRAQLSSGTVYVPETAVTPQISYRDLWGRDHTLPLRAAFFDVFSWASCACGLPGQGERHAGLNVTFQLFADLAGTGARERLVLLYPSRLGGADLDIVIKDRNQGGAIPADQMLIDMGMFRGLGVAIGPRSGDWGSSWASSVAGTRLITVETSTGYDHLLFQHGAAAGASEVITLSAKISSLDGPPVEGLLKLHDGARLVYRQQSAGPSRYEVYDTHVQGVQAAATQLRLRKQVTPVQVSTYGDTVYYIISVSDPGEPHRLSRNGPGDPFLQSYGFGRLAATTYVGGREGPQILHSVLAPGEKTRIRVEVNNNSGQALSGVAVTPELPAGLSAAPSYDPASPPPPIYAELPFLYLTSIPDAGRAVYYYDLRVAPDYAGPLGQTLDIPIRFQAAGAPADFRIPAAKIAVVAPGGSAFDVVAPAQTLVLTDTLPGYAQLTGAALVSAADVTALTDAGDAAGRAAVYGRFAATVPVTQDGAGGLRFGLPGDALTRLYDPRGQRALYVVARATISPASAGPNLANAGAQATYTDPLGATWRERTPPLLVEAHGAAVKVSYSCTSVLTGAFGDPSACALAAGQANTVGLDVTVSNPGDYPAQNVTTTLTLQPGVGLLGATPAPLATAGQTLTWALGDLGPGGVRIIHLTAQVQLDEYGAVQGLLPHMVTLVRRSDGQFTDSFSRRTISAQIGGPFAVPVRVAPEVVGAALQLSYVCAGVSWDGGQRGAPCLLEPGADNRVTLVATLRNSGRDAAQGAQVRLALPPGVSASGPGVQSQDGVLVWAPGDLAVGAQAEVQITLSAAVDRALGHTLGGPAAQLVLLGGSGGSFTDAFSGRLLALAQGPAYALPVRATMPPGGFRSFLPQVGRRAQEYPDLVVRTFSAAPAPGLPARISVVIQNQGSAPAGGFWVDLYVDPQAPPERAGTRWDQSCRAGAPCVGIAWVVAGLAPGASVTLTSDASSYAAPYTRWDGSLGTGAHRLYIYADSWGGADGRGGVAETDESNNRGEVSFQP